MNEPIRALKKEIAFWEDMLEKEKDFLASEVLERIKNARDLAARKLAEELGNGPPGHC